MKGGTGEDGWSELYLKKQFSLIKGFQCCICCPCILGPRVVYNIFPQSMI